MGDDSIKLGPAGAVVGLCRSLRAKTGYATHEGGENPWLLLDTSTTSFRCLVTLEGYGPDGYLADGDLCREGRECYSPDGSGPLTTASDLS